MAPGCELTFYQKSFAVWCVGCFVGCGVKRLSELRPTNNCREFTAKNRVFLPTHTFAYHIKRKKRSIPACILLAKRSLEDSYQRVVLTLSQSMTFRIDEL